MSNQRIQQLADELRNGTGQRSLPIDVEAIALTAGAEIISDDFKDDLSGYSIQKQGKKLIGINRNHSPNRRRFTIAHELGHLFLHSSKTVNYETSLLMFRDGRSTDGSDPKEREANRFAAELLMPESLLRKEMEKTGKIDLLDDSAHAAVQELADKFQVSSQAMAVRLATISNF